MVRAVVSHGTIETHYRRAGQGLPVVVLGMDPGDVDRCLPISLAPLVASCRVIVPEHASIMALVACEGANQVPFSAWFRGFLEGLGIEGARVVAASGLDVALMQFLAVHPGEIDRVLIVGAMQDASVAPPLANASPPVWRAATQVGWGEMLSFITSRPPSARSLAVG